MSDTLQQLLPTSLTETSPRMIFRKRKALIIPSFLLHILSLLAGVVILLTIYAPRSANPKKPPIIHDRSFLALSSDDFGRWADSVPLFPNASFIASHKDLLIPNEVWYRRATVETKTDLDRLLRFFNRLNKNVSFEHHAVLTPHFIVGGPDFEAMRAAGCGARVNSTAREYSFDCAYHEQLLSDAGPTGLDQPPYNRGDLKPVYKALFRARVWHPEYHGRSHFSVSKWIRLLRSDPKTQVCFHENLVCSTDITQLRSEFSDFANKQALKIWLEEGVNAFASFWGYRPSLLSSPHNTWSTWLADAISDLSFAGAELGEDQASNVEHGGDTSLHDRYRFDGFFPGFNCDAAIGEVVDLLSANRRPVLKAWNAVSSYFSTSRRNQNLQYIVAPHHERFVSLMWHAQNVMGSTYTRTERVRHMECLERLVRKVRSEVPRAVLVTAGELHQIRRRGWSQEVWSDGIVIRNYLEMPISIPFPELSRLLARNSMQGQIVVAERIVAGVEDQRRVRSRVGNALLLERDSVYKITNIL